MRFKKGDNVKVIIGKDKGREGKIERVFPREGKLLIPEVNMYKKHFKGNQGQKGGIYDVPRPILASKVALICPKCKKQTRIGYKYVKNEKLRVCSKCKKEIDTSGK